MRDRSEWIHARLDGEGGTSARECSDPTAYEALTRYEEVLRLLEDHREKAPEGFVQRVVAALPEGPQPSRLGWLRRLWPSEGRWAVPAVAGALAAALLLAALPRLERRTADSVSVTFELHAPGARRVELVGTFNDWKPDEILLCGPDATGHWTATVNLPSGLHEYLFLVDGRKWVTDPNAEAYRPDGFGRSNALVQL